jgi:HEAT repeat protein
VPLSPDRKAEQVTRAQRLGELIDGFPERVPGALPALREMLDSALDDDVLAASIDATGLAWHDDDALGLLIDRGWDQHPSSQVRLALAKALAAVDPDGAHADRAIQVLITLTADPEFEIRDAACAAVAELGIDGPGIRAALVARLSDDSPDARCASLAALARLGDPGVVPVLQARFEQADPFDIYLLELSAAAEIGDPALLPGLLRIDTAWQAESGGAGDEDPDETELFAELDRAIAASR